MLKESLHVQQVPGERRRRWFSDASMDLTVWFDEQDRIAGFELCYDKGTDERALRWLAGTGFVHERVDDGEGRPGRHKASPVLVPDGAFDAKKISRQFEESSREIEERIAKFVSSALESFPASGEP